MSLEYNKKLIPFAKALRKNATSQENHLWYDFLRSYTPRFQRQKTIGQFIADFYCEKAKLVIELDGSQHFTPEGHAYDAARTAAIDTFGVTVLRFTNREIDREFNAICMKIEEVVHERLSQGAPSCK